MADRMLHLTADELGQLIEQIWEISSAHHDRLEEKNLRPQDARLVSLRTPARGR